jgi:hypothetical protein
MEAQRSRVGERAGMTHEGVDGSRVAPLETTVMSLNEFLRQILFDRSLSGWRAVRPRRRETVVAVLCALVVLYAVAVLVSTAVGTRCLVDWNANSCNGWTNH